MQWDAGKVRGLRGVVFCRSGLKWEQNTLEDGGGAGSGKTTVTTAVSHAMSVGAVSANAAENGGKKTFTFQITHNESGIYEYKKCFIFRGKFIMLCNI